MTELMTKKMETFISKIVQLPFALKFFLLFSIIFGSLIIKIVPPLQAPDEIGHYVKAEAFTELKLRPQARSEATGTKGIATWGEYGFRVSNDITRMNEYANQSRGKKAVFPYQVKDTHNSKRDFIGTGGITNYSFINYIPQMIGIGIGKVIQKPIIWQYYAARICNLLFYIIILFFTIKMFPFSKWGATIFALNPMALFLSASVSGDGMIIAGGFFFVSWMLNLLRTTTLTNRHMVISSGLLASLVLMKPTMIVLGMLFFLIPNKTLDLKRKAIWGIGIFSMCVLLYVLWNKLMIDQQLLYRDFADPAKQVNTFLKNPGIFFTNFFENYLFGIKGDGILYSFVGNFGWLDTPLGLQWVVLYFIILTIGCLVRQDGGLSLLIYQRLVLLAAISIYVLLTFFALYQIWNKVGRAESIEGLQGRYFIPASLLLVPLFSSQEKILSVTNRKINLILSICMLLVLLATLITLNNRYL